MTDHPRDECGVVGIYGVDDAAPLAALAQTGDQTRPVAQSSAPASGSVGAVTAAPAATAEDLTFWGYGDTQADPQVHDVLAAAIQGGASVIVTQNLKDFPEATLAPFNIAAVHPDDFITGLVASDPGPVVVALAADRERLRHPPMTVAEYLVGLERAGLRLTAATLRPFANSL